MVRQTSARYASHIALTLFLLSVFVVVGVAAKPTAIFRRDQAGFVERVAVGVGA